MSHAVPTFIACYRAHRRPSPGIPFASSAPAAAADLSSEHLVLPILGPSGFAASPIHHFVDFPLRKRAVVPLHLSTFIAAVFQRFRRDATGASLIEYALILALITIVAIGALIVIGNVTNNSINNAGNAFP